MKCSQCKSAWIDLCRKAACPTALNAHNPADGDKEKSAQEAGERIHAEQAMKTKSQRKSKNGPSVSSTAVLHFSLPREAAKAFNALKAADWTEDDWRDLLLAHNWVLKRVATRHGLTSV